jgi:hypothetical protein
VGVQAQAENSMMGDKKKAAEAKARQAKKDEEKRRLDEERLLFHVVEDKKKNDGAEEDFLKSTKQMMEEYEYQSSVSALGKPIAGQAGSIEEDIEMARFKIAEKDKLTVTEEWFLFWAEEYKARLERKDKKSKGGFGRKQTGRELFQQHAQGDFEDDEEAEEGWSERQEGDEDECVSGDDGPDQEQPGQGVDIDAGGGNTRTASPASANLAVGLVQQKDGHGARHGAKEVSDLAAALKAVHIN